MKWLKALTVVLTVLLSVPVFSATVSIENLSAPAVGSALVIQNEDTVSFADLVSADSVSFSGLVGDGNIFTAGFSLTPSEQLDFDFEAPASDLLGYSLSSEPYSGGELFVILGIQIGDTAELRIGGQAGLDTIYLSLFSPGQTVYDLATSNLVSVNPVPLPPAVWLLGSALLALAGMARQQKAGAGV